ncbi:MAG: hypothetical protein Q9208_007292 [Pyrenodesmia sp. 3 TL-2023]
MANIVKGLRVVSGVEGEIAVGVKDTVQGEEKPLGKDDSLKVLAASNTILALVLVGVLVLQAGQWYAERKQTQEIEEMRKDKAAANKGNGGAQRVGTAKKKA